MTSTRFETMKAAVLEKPGRLRLRDCPVPTPGKGEVLIHVKVCGLCSTDLKLLHGDYKTKTPVILGHEFAGKVVALGKGVRGFHMGDRVAVDPNTSCGACAECRAHRPMFCRKLKGYGVLRDGALAEYVVVDFKSAHRIPDRLPYYAAALAEPVSCAVHAVDRAAPAKGDTVAVIGGGLQGQILVQLFRQQGLRQVMMITRSREKLRLAGRLGATACIRAGDHAAREILRQTAGRGVDIAVEAVGKPLCLELAVRLAAPGGRVVLYGLAPEAEAARLFPSELLRKELTLLAAWLNPNTFGRALDLLAKRTVDVRPLITKTLPLEQIAQGLETMEKQPPGFLKALIRPRRTARGPLTGEEKR